MLVERVRTQIPNDRHGLQFAPRVRPGRPILAYLTGVAAGLVVTISHFRPFGVPIAYGTILIVAFCAIAGGFRVQGRTLLIIGAWAVPVAYAVFHDAAVSAGETLQLVTRNSIALLAAMLLAWQMGDRRKASLVLAGIGTVMLIDSMLGIGQARGIGWLIAASLPFGSVEITDEFLSGATTLRSWGMHSHVHMYAYTLSLWVFAGFAWVLSGSVAPGRAKRTVMIMLLVGVVALVLSAQRSAVWSVAGAILLVFMVRGRTDPRILAGLALIGVAVMGLLAGVLSAESESPVARLLAPSDVASDSERTQSWIEGWRVLQDDPYVGAAFGSYGGSIGIHNGFLGGWAQYGLPWLVAVVFAVGITVLHFVSARGAAASARVSAVLMVGVMLANAMFHTAAPARNDIPFLVFLGTMLALVGPRVDASGFVTSTRSASG